MDRKTSILIVDEYRTMLRIVRRILLQLGYDDVDCVVDAAAALERLDQKHYDLVISDWNLHPMSGLDLLRAVRSRAALRTLPFLMITAADRDASVMAAEDAGASGHITKPFDAETLHAKVQSAFAA